VIVCDTGPLVAAADRDDQHNRACTDLFTGLHLARRAILVPAPVVAEVGCLLGRAGGAKIEAAFLRSIVQETLTVDLELVDYERMAELVEVIRRLPVGTTDAAVVAVAERLGITEIATLDRRHFHAVRASACRRLRPAALIVGPVHAVGRSQRRGWPGRSPVVPVVV
jgi:predicted nucleic acid-binding protein